MLEIFRCELEAKEQTSLTVKAEKGYEKSRENYTTGALYSASKLSYYQASSRNPASGSRKNLVYFVKAIIHYFAVLKLLIRKFERI